MSISDSDESSIINVEDNSDVKSLEGISPKIFHKMRTFLKITRNRNKLAKIEMNVGYLLKILNAISFNGSESFPHGMTALPLSIFCCTYISIIFAYLKPLVDKYKTEVMVKTQGSEEKDTRHTNKSTASKKSLLRSFSRKSFASSFGKRKLSKDSKKFIKTLKKTGKVLDQSIMPTGSNKKQDGGPEQFEDFFGLFGYLRDEDYSLNIDALSELLHKMREVTAGVWNELFSSTFKNLSVKVISIRESGTDFNVTEANIVVPCLIDAIVEAIACCYDNCVNNGKLDLDLLKRKIKKLSEKSAKDTAFKQITQLEQFFDGFPFNFALLKSHLEFEKEFMKKLEDAVAITKFEEKYPTLFRETVLKPCVGQDSNERFKKFFLNNILFAWKNLIL